MASEAMFKDCNIGTMSNPTIANRDINIYHSSTVPALKTLLENAAPGAFHESHERCDPPKCYENTRVAIRENLLIQVTTALVSCIIWLYGAAGAGKSAIAQSFAEMCQKEGLLVGSFFFFRAAALRNNAERLAASLAYQLALSIELTRKHIEHCIRTDPAIFSSSLNDQLDRLFIQPLHQACKEDTTLQNGRPKVVILDGLDECDIPDIQKGVLRVLDEVLKTSPIPIVVLIASRPEIHISSTFDHLSSTPIFRFGLNDSYDVDADIQLFLKDKFSDLKRNHPFKKFIPDDWPLPHVVESIVTKSSGQFIYAATIIRYIGHDVCKPHERLQIALDASKRFTSTSGDSPFKELDALYFQIFSGLKDTVTTLTIIHLALDLRAHSPQIVGQGRNILLSQHPRTIAFRLGLNPGDVELHVSNLASLLKLEGEDTPIRFFHASLDDFLVNQQRSHHLYIFQPAVCATMYKAFMRRFLASDPSLRELQSLCDPYLANAEPNEELSMLAAEVELKIPQFIKTYRASLGRRDEWYDREDSNASDFGVLFETVKLLELKLGGLTKSSNFWHQCIEGIEKLLYKQLSVYLINDATHDFLAILLFGPSRPYPSRHFASLIGLSDSAWETCRSDEIFNSKFLSMNAEKFIRLFLLDSSRSGKLFISSKRLVAVASKCFSMLIEPCLLKDADGEVVGVFIGDDRKEGFKRASESLYWMLRELPGSLQLITCIKKFNCPPQQPNVQLYKVKGEIDLYLKRHRYTVWTMSATERVLTAPVDRLLGWTQGGEMWWLGILLLFIRILVRATEHRNSVSIGDILGTLSRGSRHKRA